MTDWIRAPHPQVEVLQQFGDFGGLAWVQRTGQLRRDDRMQQDLRVLLVAEVQLGVQGFRPARLGLFLAIQRDGFRQIGFANLGQPLGDFLPASPPG